MRFITNYRKLNQKFVRNMYPLPRIGDTVQHLEGFQYATTSYLNMCYYTIRIFPACKDIMEIVNEFDKFVYNCIHMGMCYLGYIFQAKLENLISYIEGVKGYIDDIFVLRKDCFTKPIEQLSIIFGRLSAASLKINSPK